VHSEKNPVSYRTGFQDPGSFQDPTTELQKGKEGDVPSRENSRAYFVSGARRSSPFGGPGERENFRSKNHVFPIRPDKGKAVSETSSRYHQR